MLSRSLCLLNDKLMDPCWKLLPYDLVEKICNMLIKVRRIDTQLSDEIQIQWYKYDKWFYNCMSLFGMNNVYYIMYDDLINIAELHDDFPNEMNIIQVVQEMWKKCSHEQRDEITMTY